MNESVEETTVLDDYKMKKDKPMIRQHSSGYYKIAKQQGWSS